MAEFYDEHFHDQCGVFGIFGHAEASNLAYLGLYAQQHRGQESAGIVSTDGNGLHSHRQMGLVADIFTQDVLAKLPGKSAIGHVRYSTAGGSLLKNAQPFVVEYSRGAIAIAHNGNLTNAQTVRDELEAYGSIFQSTMDTEVIVHLIALSQFTTLEDRIAAALKRIEGAYSLCFLTEDKLIGVRDPNGFRPLVLGKIGEAYVLASETCAFDLIEAEYLREIEPGEVVTIDQSGLKSFFPFEKRAGARCVFEHIYFARPDSIIYGSNVYEMRKAFGRQLAKERPVAADLVIPVPDSGVPAAIGYAQEANLPFELGLIRNHYVGRTFIEPHQNIRHFGVKIKLNALPGYLKGKRVVVVDDSLVRGTTSRKIVKMLRAAGAAEVHLRLSSPPIISPCFYGIDTPTKSELIASSHSLQEIERYVTCDTVAYLSVEGLAKVAGASGYCNACFTGKYPVSIIDQRSPQMRLFEV
jgi:amidophosphoribosyltransferase